MGEAGAAWEAVAVGGAGALGEARGRRSGAALATAAQELGVAGEVLLEANAEAPGSGWA
jgi:hypothetical protein